MTDRKEKLATLDALVDQVVAGRAAEVRGPSAGELKATQGMMVPLEEASAKVRAGPPLDAARDYKLDIWAGVVPLRQEALEPVADPRLAAGIAVPEHVQRYIRRTRKDSV